MQTQATDRESLDLKDWNSVNCLFEPESGVARLCGEAGGQEGQQGTNRAQQGTEFKCNLTRLKVRRDHEQQLTLPKNLAQCQPSGKCDCLLGQKMCFFLPMSMDNGLTFVCAATCGGEFPRRSCTPTRWSRPGTPWCWPGSRAASASPPRSSWSQLSPLFHLELSSLE